MATHALHAAVLPPAVHAAAGVLSGAAPTAGVLVDGSPLRAAGSGAAGAARGLADGAILALPALLVALLVGRRRRRG